MHIVESFVFRGITFRRAQLYPIGEGYVSEKDANDCYWLLDRADRKLPEPDGPARLSYGDDWSDGAARSWEFFACWQFPSGSQKKS